MFLALNLSDVVSILLINVKMPTVVAIFTFISMINRMLSSVEHEKVYNLRTRVYFCFISFFPNKRNVVHG